MYRASSLYREFVLHGALVDLRQRYAGTGFGSLWLLAQPLSQIVVFTAVFSGIMEVPLGRASSRDVDFAVYLCAVLLPWIGFSEIVGRSTNCLIANSRLILVIGVPEEPLFVKEGISGFVSMLAGTAPLPLLVAVMGPPLTWNWLWLPLVMLLFAALGLGIGMTMGVLNVLVRDVGHSVGVVLQVLLWSSPIVYVESILPAWYRPILPFLPPYPFVSALHEIVAFGAAPDGSNWAAMLAFALGALAVGLLLVRTLRPAIRDGL